MILFVRFNFFIILCFAGLAVSAQTGRIRGRVTGENGPVEFASIRILGGEKGSASDSSGRYTISNLPYGNYTLRVSAVGYAPLTRKVQLRSATQQADFILKNSAGSLDEVVVSGTLKAVNRMESPVPVEVYTPAFLRKNPTPNIFDALQNVNGVRPQLNCNICNTGDIHINGLEGPYTMILIDGMPIVSSLSTVYGLSGIPNSLIERMEIVKGPASSLYGSEAVGGLINIITKNPATAPRVTADVFATSWQEYNADLGAKFSIPKTASVLTGINYFNFQNPLDMNGDGFTDVTQQHRISLFQKWNFERKENRLFSVAGRYLYEDRWGGETRWNKELRGTDERYGESIYTRRFELIGQYQLPVKERLMLGFSYTNHNQNSFYGTVPYMAQQQIGFAQLVWDHKAGRHDLLAGTALRYTFYDDNTPATSSPDGVLNQPERTALPGVFVQDEIGIAKKHKLLLGARYDYNSRHGHIFTPRVAWKWSAGENDIIRLNAGTGFRVVNLFTEDHAALTGAREVIIRENLRPERSYNINLNYLKKMYSENGSVFGLEASAFYTYFNNRIIGDFDSNPNQIIYANLNGHAVSRGLTLNADAALQNGWKFLVGATLMDVFSVQKNGAESSLRMQQILTERWTGTWAITVPLRKWHLSLDYTGNIYGPMRLPLLGSLDPRNSRSPVWSIQNIQLTQAVSSKWEIYGGVKNLLNWTPARNQPFLIAGSNDPFDKNVQFDAGGQVIATPQNPYALTFDPNYVYAPNQGIRGFLGLRYTLR